MGQVYPSMISRTRRVRPLFMRSIMKSHARLGCDWWRRPRACSSCDRGGSDGGFGKSEEPIPGGGREDHPGSRGFLCQAMAAKPVAQA